MDELESSSCSCEVVQVAIVNKDTLNDKIKENAIISVVGGVATILATQGIPWAIKKVAELRERKAIEKAKKDVEKD